MGSFWKKIAIDRAQHFSGIDRGINRRLSIAYIKSLALEADDIQFKLDHGIIPSVDPDTDPRPKLKILRMILSAGIQTPERDHRHRKRQGTPQCICGNGVPTIHHISWECSCFRDIRDDNWQHLPSRLQDLPMCFQLTTLVPIDMNISESQVIGIQKVLVQIWQTHIKNWYDTTDTDPESRQPQNSDINADPAPASSAAETEQPAAPTIKKGHILKLIPEGGVFCCRCGKQTKNMKHQRLKILNKPCKFPDLDPSQWLTAPGFHNSTNRIKAAENDLNRKYNLGKHSLVWKHKLGKIKNKPDYGLIWCALCGRTWRWDKRMCNLSKTKCHPSETPPVPPDWVITLDHFDPSTTCRMQHPKCV